MPRIVSILGDEPREPVEQVVDLSPSASIAWTLDPYSQVPDEYKHLVEAQTETNQPDNKEQE